jgi:hypothetical protein
MGSRIRKLVRENKSKRNFHLSTSSLEKDLAETSFTLYRGSAVAIESLAFNNSPIYLNFDGNLNLNVFSIIDSSFPVLKNVSDQSEFFNILAGAKSNTENMKIYKELFEPINKNILEQICP